MIEVKHDAALKTGESLGMSRSKLPKLGEIYKRSRWHNGALAGLAVLVVWTLYVSLWNGSSWRSWTGFGEYTSPAGEHHRAKTLWDWMSLLIIPTALAVGAWVLNKWQAGTDRQIEAERQRQAMFEAYVDHMTVLLLKEGLRQTQGNGEVRTIARARTLAVLNALDGERKGELIRFLFESNLITINSRVIDLTHANLDGIHLVWASLKGIDLMRTHLSGAQLKWAHLEHCNLAYTKMVNADLRGAYLQHANLQGANLAGANLREADLEEANMENAHLEDAQLRRAILLGASFVGARYNQQTQWPDGFDFSRSELINVDIERDKAEFYPGDE